MTIFSEKLLKNMQSNQFSCVGLFSHDMHVTKINEEIYDLESDEFSLRNYNG